MGHNDGCIWLLISLKVLIKVERENENSGGKKKYVSIEAQYIMPKIDNSKNNSIRLF